MKKGILFLLAIVPIAILGQTTPTLKQVTGAGNTSTKPMYYGSNIHNGVTQYWVTDKKYVDSIAAIGAGTVTSFSYTNGNGFTGTVNNASTTPTLSLSLQNATTSQSGQLTSTDWNTFNGKENVLTFSNGLTRTVNTVTVSAAQPGITTATNLVSVGTLTAGAVPLSLTTGTLTVAKGGTGLTTFGGTNTILYTTAAGTLTSSSNLTYDGTTLQSGTATLTSLYAGKKMIVAGSAADAAAFFASFNSNTSGYSGFVWGQSDANFFGMYTAGSAVAGNASGTSIPLANTVNFQSGNVYQLPATYGASVFTMRSGSTITNFGSRLDAVGFRIDQIQNIHTTNNNVFTVNGNSFFGANSSALGIVHIAGGTASTPNLILNSQTSCTTTVDGSLWNDVTAHQWKTVLNSNTYQLATVLTATATLDFGNLVSIGCEDLTITVTGAALGDAVSIGVQNGSVPSSTTTFTGWVSATNTVTIRCCTLVSGDPASGIFKATVIKN